MFKRQAVHKISSAVLSICLAASAPAILFADTPVVGAKADAPTVDAKASDKVKTAVEELFKFGVVSGKTDGKFDEGSNLKRDEFAKMLVVALGLSDAANAVKGTTRFSDVSKDNWASQYIAVAASKGLIKGSTSGKFSPDDEVTYAQYATMVVRALGYEDSDLVGNWPVNYLKKAAELGLLNDLTINGAPVSTSPDKNTLFENAPVKRGDAAVMLADVIDKDAKGDFVDPNGVVKHAFLLDNVKDKVGVEEVTGVVVADKTINPSLGDKVTILSKTDNGTDTLSDYSISSLTGTDVPGIGAKVDFWYNKNDSNKTIVYVVRTMKSAPVVIRHAALTQQTKNGIISYSIGGKDENNADTTPCALRGDAYVIINGKHSDASKIGYNTITNDYTADTNITLIDNTDDGIYDFAIVNQTNKVDGIVAADKTIDPSLGDKIAVLSKNGSSNSTVNYAVYSGLNIPQIGTATTFYVNDNNEIVNFEPKQNNQVKITGFEKINDKATDYNYLEYNNGTCAKISKGAYYIINGKHTTDYNKIGIDPVTNLFGADTDIKLVSIDNSDLYDLVIVNQTSKPCIVLKDVGAADTSIELSKNLSLALPGSLKVTGSVSNLEDIKKDDVLYVTEPCDNSSVSIDVYRNPVEGTITEKILDKDAKYVQTITINGVKYTIDDSIRTSKETDNATTAGNKVKLFSVGKNNLVLALELVSRPLVIGDTVPTYQVKEIYYSDKCIKFSNENVYSFEDNIKFYDENGNEIELGQTAQTAQVALDAALKGKNVKITVNSDNKITSISSK